ncbi:hypothetical protein AYI69_g4643 [Smittium culicis]|uniref:Uncharacterized protein n=1 Tax=Smittium culicis TaxID=133412 RepID=A0A1R1YC12_9FUNG|nr:hypothetical protein AYI69_g4643 [Smittium culicis]
MVCHVDGKFAMGKVDIPDKLNKAGIEVVRTILFQILKATDENRDHIPAITSSEPGQFPFRVELVSGSAKWGSVLKNLL